MDSGRSNIYEHRRREGETRRKFAQVWTDQLDDLSPIARELQDAKPANQPRITENTLLRIGADLVLELASHLEGDNEDEIRDNLLRLISVNTQQ